MNTSLIATNLQRYEEVVTRYARFIVKDHDAANELALEVISKLCSEPHLTQIKDQKRFLKHFIQNSCHRWLHDNALLLLKNQSPSTH